MNKVNKKRMKPNLINLLFLVLASSSLVLVSSCGTKKAPFKTSGAETTEFNTISEQFLAAAMEGKDTKAMRDKLANVSIDELSKTLKTDEQRFAFWINTYNAYIQYILREHPEYFKDRRTFFANEQIPIAGETVAFAQIEHGVIRKSQWPLGLGYIRKVFPDKFERKLRVKHRDYHVHFALNCGAKDCPPVAIYTPSRIREQLNKGTTAYLNKTSIYDATKNEIKVTPLFSWFRGDFGGKGGVKKILKSYDIVPSTKGLDVEYKGYDWTLDLENFTDL